MADAAVTQVLVGTQRQLFVPNEDDEKQPFTIRSATFADVKALLELEEIVWRDQQDSTPATQAMIEGRIKHYPRGSIVAEQGGKIIAWVVFFPVTYPCVRVNGYWRVEQHFSHMQITGNGTLDPGIINQYLSGAHDEKHANSVYGVNLSVHPDYGNRGVGSYMVGLFQKFAEELNVPVAFLGSRVPTYNSACFHSNGGGDPDIEEYITRRFQEGPKQGLLVDDELRFYESIGFKVVKNALIRNYMIDPPSRNYGVLVFWNNPNYLE